MRSILLIEAILALLCFCVSGQSAMASCPRYMAPAKFNNSPQSWGNDSGPIVDGFIDVRGTDGKSLDLVQGVDLSHYNVIDYSKLKDCGGLFAFVQMDGAFQRHFDGLVDVGVTPIPYYFLSLPGELRRAAQLPEKPSVEELANLRNKYAEAGRLAAVDFIQRVTATSRKVPLASVAGLNGHFVAVDVEQTVLGPSSQLQQQKYGQLYATAVCSWLNTVSSQPEMQGTIPVLYTFPAIYGQYLTYAFPEENRCLEGLPVWIARTFPSGGEALRDPNAKSGVELFVQRLCIVQAGNRCLVHQYTHRGIFMARAGSPGRIPVHFDLDRFYKSAAVPTPGGAQFVRVQDPFK